VKLVHSLKIGTWFGLELPSINMAIMVMSFTKAFVGSGSYTNKYK
jgi:hypothetical protein